MTSAATLALWCATVRWDQIPSELQLKAQDHLLDTLGAAVAGRTSDVAKIAESVYSAPGSVQVLIGTGPRELRHAARINAIAAHALEIDDTEGCDHSGAVVVPVLLALLDEYSAVSGARLLTALVVGYEVGRRVQLALGGYQAHNNSGWHSTATCGVFAATAAASVMLTLSPDQTASALGIAASSSAGSWAFSGNGAMTKQFHAGNAAANGIDAALLAQAGAVGPQDIFEPVWGSLFQTHGNPAVDPAQLIKGLGSRWHFSHSAIKPYASCRSSHSAIDAAMEIMSSQQLQPKDILRIEIEVNPFLMPMICPSAPTAVSTARMSLPVCLALLMQGKSLVPEDFEDFQTPESVLWLARVTVIQDDSSADTEPLVRIVTRRGTFSGRHRVARGGESLPLLRAAVESKFDGLVGDHLNADTAQAIKTFVQDLPNLQTPIFPATY